MVLRRNNTIIKKAIEHGDLEAVDFLIDNGLYTHVSKGMLKKLGKLTGASPLQKKELMAKMLRNVAKTETNEFAKVGKNV